MKRLVAVLLAALMLALPAVAESNMEGTAEYLRETVPDPCFGCEWIALGMWAGKCLPEEWANAYVPALEETLAECGGDLGAKRTEYAKLTLAVTALGLDAQDIGGYDLVAPLREFDAVVRQGLNGAIFALIALDSGEYAAPQDLRRQYVEYILARQTEDGGFAFSGSNADADMTAMALCSLAAYRQEDAVGAAVDAAVECLSQMQREDGGYASCGTPNAESCAQVILALTSLGIDVEDARFVKNGTSVAEALDRYRLEDGSYAHLEAGNTAMLATQQAFLALAAMERAKDGEAGVYCIRSGGTHA